MTANKSLSRLLPVLFGFFIMGLVDIVGISTSFVKKDFALSDSMSNLLPSMVFLWFAVFSVPTGLLMNKIGRKNTVLISMTFTIIALFLPVISYNFIMVLIAFAFLGIGNTILQVSLNPLISNIVTPEKLTSTLTFGQFIKAISSFLGPIIAGFAALALGNWKLMFPLFAIITFISTLWLILTPIEESQQNIQTTTISSSLKLLGNNKILILFLGILFVVGVDVGMNTVTPKFLMERSGMIIEKAGLGTSIYFAARTVGALIGSILLAKYSSKLFFRISILFSIAALVTMIFLENPIAIFITVAIIGFSIANIFSIIFSIALQKLPERTNEISGLMIMGIAGGAIFPPIMGLMADSLGQRGALIVILFCMLYLILASFLINKERENV